MILTDQGAIARWVLERKADADLHNWAGIASVVDGEIACAVIYNHPAYKSINGHILSDGKKRWATKEFVRMMFWYPFVALGMNRITAPIAESNSDAIKLVEKLGFILEGRMRGYRNNGEAQLIYGILREECKYV